MSILVVESSPATRESLCYTLLSLGVKGIPAATRPAAWEAVRGAADIEAVIVDIDNRDVEGAALVEELRRDEKTRGLAVIVHTVQSGKDFVMTMIESGVAGYLLKPYDTARARDKLAAILAKLATHNGQRRHFRVRPDPDDLARAHFRLAPGAPLFSGRILDVSLGGMAMELLTPPAEGLLVPGTRIPRLEFVLGGRGLAPQAAVVLARARVLALRFESMAPADTKSLERYIFRKISS